MRSVITGYCVLRAQYIGYAGKYMTDIFICTPKNCSNCSILSLLFSWAGFSCCYPGVLCCSTSFHITRQDFPSPWEDCVPMKYIYSLNLHVLRNYKLSGIMKLLRPKSFLNSKNHYSKPYYFILFTLANELINQISSRPKTSLCERYT